LGESLVAIYKNINAAIVTQAEACPYNIVSVTSCQVAKHCKCYVVSDCDCSTVRCCKLNRHLCTYCGLNNIRWKWNRI